MCLLHVFIHNIHEGVVTRNGAGRRLKKNFGLPIFLCGMLFASSLFLSGSPTVFGTASAPVTRDISSYGQISYYPSRLHTNGRWIEDVNGDVIRLKGAAVAWRFMYAGHWHDYDPLSYDDEINEASMDLFASTHANFIRLTVNGWTWFIKNAPKYIAAVDMVIQWCKTRGIMVVLDNHGWFDDEIDTWYKTNEQLGYELTEWKDFIVALAERYKDEPTVIGFDMLNEPTSAHLDLLTWDIWRTNVLDVVRAVHAVDPSYLCFVEPLGSSAQRDDMNNFKTNPLPEPNIVYCAHMYYAWDYPWFDYAINYANGNFEAARAEMEALYYERCIDMNQANLPVMNMETGVYRNTDPTTSSSDPNWNVWENDSLALYEKYNLSVCWFSFDPDREDSSIFSLLAPSKTDLTPVGDIWAMHMSPST